MGNIRDIIHPLSSPSKEKPQATHFTQLALVVLLGYPPSWFPLLVLTFYSLLLFSSLGYIEPPFPSLLSYLLLVLFFIFLSHFFCLLVAFAVYTFRVVCFCFLYDLVMFGNVTYAFDVIFYHRTLRQVD